MNTWLDDYVLSQMALLPDEGIVHDVAEVPDSRASANVSSLVNDRCRVYVACLGGTGGVGHSGGALGDYLISDSRALRSER